MKGYLRRRQENEVLAVSVDTFFSPQYLFNNCVMVFDPPRYPSFTETHCDAKRGGGQRDRDMEEKAGRGSNERRTQKIPLAQSERESFNEEEIPNENLKYLLHRSPLPLNKTFSALIWS